MSLEAFHHFFDCCIGGWSTERTYHYLTRQEVERSHTEFAVRSLSAETKAQVLAVNVMETEQSLEQLPGFCLGFHTVSEHGEEVSQELNMLFVPRGTEDGWLVGDYLRDRAYEEARPIISAFRFNPDSRELLMTTHYTRIVSVDSITLVNPRLRVRRILNYVRPTRDDQPLDTLALVGFGVEQKTDG
ncbi:phycobiliprotein lyase [Synechococcus elongatus]|uniref:Chromophore lyase CpcS/CpeS n=1 Tax=Synechococcus elongatus PCC 11802 TaxID=2283154 RepID=A0AAT9JW07_SYNEL|nr:phycobiliprotein lyase [Synechococcus elongatus]QFZ92248.1 phycobiliprotein lyase [Synechococcus elongatus PCC 11802]